MTETEQSDTNLNMLRTLAELREIPAKLKALPRDAINENLSLLWTTNALMMDLNTATMSHMNSIVCMVTSMLTTMKEVTKS